MNRPSFMVFKGMIFTVLLPLVLSVNAACSRAVQLDEIRLPPGFRIDLYASDVPGARSMALGPNNILFVGTRDTGKVYALLDRNKDSKAETLVTIAANLNMPNGVAFHDGSLFVAEVHRVLEFKDIETKLENSGQPRVVNDAFPADRHHGWKFIRFGPDNLLYVPVGAPCNICDAGDPYAALLRMRPDGSGLETFARGIRNTVGFDWHPRTGELWFTDNGRDWLGDDQPPDELNHAPRQGMHFGYPYWHGTDIPDPDIAPKLKLSEITGPARELGAHVAALGMRFYTGAMFPPEYRNQIFIAEHGSWNRLLPVGYRITLVRLRENRPVSYEVFADGWLQGGSASGRPVDLLVMPDGALLVSDDLAGVIYRISYSTPKAAE